MRTLSLMSALAAALLIAAACTGPTGSTGTPYSMKVAPKTITIAVPSSLVTPSAGTRSLSNARDFGAGGLGFFRSEDRGAYHWVKDSMWQAEKRLARAAVRLVLVDSIITANSLSAGTTAAPTHQAATQGHVWTDAEVAAYQAMIPAAFLSDSAFGTDAKLPKAGDTSDLPAFDYIAADSSDTVNYPTYADKVVFTPVQSEDDTVATHQESISFYWSADKTQFKVAYEKDDTSTTPVSVVEQQFVAFDSTASTLVAGLQSDQGSMDLSVKADPASTTNGVFIAFDSTINANKAYAGAADSDINASGVIFSLSAQGYADGSGGYLEETFVITIGSGSSTFYFKETFDGTGRLVLVQSATDSTFTTLTTIANVSGEGTGGDSFEGQVGRQEGRGPDRAPEHGQLNGERRRGCGAQAQRRRGARLGLRPGVLRPEWPDRAGRGRDLGRLFRCGRDNADRLRHRHRARPPAGQVHPEAGAGHDGVVPRQACGRRSRPDRRHPGHFRPVGSSAVVRA